MRIRMRIWIWIFIWCICGSGYQNDADSCGSGSSTLLDSKLSTNADFVRLGGERRVWMQASRAAPPDKGQVHLQAAGQPLPWPGPLHRQQLLPLRVRRSRFVTAFTVRAFKDIFYQRLRFESTFF
jgi:hypothetical protein